MAKGSSTQGLFDAALINAVKGLAIGNDPNAPMPPDVTSAPAMRNLNPMQQQVLTGRKNSTLEQRLLQEQAAAARVSRTKFAEEQALLAGLNPAARAARTGDSSYGRPVPVKTNQTSTTPTTSPNQNRTPSTLGQNLDMGSLPEFNVTTPPALDVDEAFDAAAAGVSEIYSQLATKDYSQMIKHLVAQGRLAAGNLNTAQLKEIADATTRRDEQLKKIQTDTKTDVTALNTQRIAQMGALENALSERMRAFKDRTNAFIAQGQDRIAELGPEISGEFTEMATMVSTMVDSMSESSIGSMERLSAVANMAAAQRLAAPALMYMDAKTALGDERMRMEHEANMLKATTLESLNVQERELLLNEAMRIEQFNNNRDMSEAQALVNLGMTKLQATIDEVHRAEDKAERARTLQISTMLQQQAAEEDKRQWEAEFGLKKSTAASATASAAAQNKFLAENSAWDVSDVSAMSDSMRKELFDQISEANAAMQTDMAEMQNEYFDLTNNGWTAGQASTAINFWNNQMSDLYAKKAGVPDNDPTRQGFQKVMETIKAPYMRKNSWDQSYMGDDWTPIEQAIQRLIVTHDPPDKEGNIKGLAGKYSGSPGLMSPGSIVPAMDPETLLRVGLESGW